ncbi:MAG: glycosyltransferase [Bacillota bacterium]|nr:glycosyltransferase [Bacillota bacterium]
MVEVAPMVIGEFNESFLPVMDGVGNAIKNYCYWLTKMGHECYVATSEYPGYTDNEIFEVIRCKSVSVPTRKPYRVSLPSLDYDFRKQIRRIPFDIIHAHCPFNMGSYALKVGKESGVPVCATFHSKFYDDFKAGFKSRFISRIMLRSVVSFFESVDFVFAVNEPTIMVLREYGFKGNVEVLENACEYYPVIDVSPLKIEFNQKYGIGEDEIVLLFVGQHVKVKNIKLILKSCAILKNSGLRFKLFTAGEGADLAELKSMASALGISDRTHFLGRVQDRHELQNIYARANLFLFPSTYDTAGIVIMEAAAVKCPSLVISGTNASVGIRNGYNGFLGPASAAGFAERILEILKHPENLVTAGENAQKTLSVHWKTRMEQVCAKYEEIIEKYKKSSQVKLP